MVYFKRYRRSRILKDSISFFANYTKTRKEYINIIMLIFYKINNTFCKENVKTVKKSSKLYIF